MHWARFADYRGKEIGKPISFTSNRQGFEKIAARIGEICKGKILNNAETKSAAKLTTEPDSVKPKTKPETKSKQRNFNNTINSGQVFDNAIIGMEPTGHYRKTLADYLTNIDYKVVCVNPYHTKKAKELNDNSQTKSDLKDTLTIALSVKDGRFFNPYLPQDIYAELRVPANTRVSVMKRLMSVKNTVTAILDEYFPEIRTVFKNPTTGKASRQILKSCPFPSLILEMDESSLLTEIKKAVKKTVGAKKVKELITTAKESIGVKYGLQSAKLRLEQLLDESELIEKHLGRIESSMEETLMKTGYGELFLSVKGIGIITAASFLGETGDPLRFGGARQIANYAGYNLVEDSSSKSKSGTHISKRGRSQLRSLLYNMAFTMVSHNAEMKALHKYLTTRNKNPLKKKQSLVAVSKKIITVIYALLKKQAVYTFSGLTR